MDTLPHDRREFDLRHIQYLFSIMAGIGYQLVQPFAIATLRELCADDAGHEAKSELGVVCVHQVIEARLFLVQEGLAHCDPATAFKRRACPGTKIVTLVVLWSAEELDIDLTDQFQENRLRVRRKTTDKGGFL